VLNPTSALSTDLPVDECEKGNPPKLYRRRVLLRLVPPAEAVGATALAVGLHSSSMFPQSMLSSLWYLPHGQGFHPSTNGDKSEKN